MSVKVNVFCAGNTDHRRFDGRSSAILTNAVVYGAVTGVNVVDVELTDDFGC